MANGRIEDWELLSAYVDGALRKDDREALEARLLSDPALRSLLDELRGNIDLLRQAPTLDLPRNFKLDPVKYRRAAPWWARYASMQRLGMLGTAAAILLIAVGVLLGSPFLQTIPQSDTGQAASSAIQQTEADNTAAVAMQGTALPTSTAILAFAPAPTMARTEEAARNAATETQAGQDTVDAITVATNTAIAAMESQATAAAESAADTAGGAAIALTETATDTAVPTGTQSAANEVAPPAVAQATTAAEYAATFPASPTIPVASTIAPPTQLPLPTAAPTAAPTADEFAAKTGSPTPVQVPILLVIGIPLLLLSAMLFILGWLRGRIGA